MTKLRMPSSTNDALVAFAELDPNTALCGVVCRGCPDDLECDGCPGLAVVAHMEKLIGKEMMKLARELIKGWRKS